MNLQSDFAFHGSWLQTKFIQARIVSLGILVLEIFQDLCSLVDHLSKLLIVVLIFPMLLQV